MTAAREWVLTGALIVVYVVVFAALFALDRPSWERRAAPQVELSDDADLAESA